MRALNFFTSSLLAVAAISSIAQGQHFEFIQTNDNCTILIQRATIDGELLDPGNDAIGVFTPAGLCAGTSYYNNNMWGIPTWGDDDQTQEVDGFQAGETFSFRIWDAAAETELIGTIGQYIMGNGRYSAGSTHVMNLLTGQPANHPPVLEAIGNKETSEGNLLEFQLSASDEDNDNLEFAGVDLPGGAVLNGMDFSWTPGFDQQGEYQMTFNVSDGSASDEETIIISVVDVNRSPILSEVGDRTIDEGATLTIQLTASDPDQDQVFFSAEDLPEGAVLDGDQFSWQPLYNQSGTYEITFIVIDDADEPLSDEELIIVTVINVNVGHPFEYLQTNDNCTILIQRAMIDGELLDPENDAIGVFTPAGLCAGVSYYNNNMWGIPTWGDDDQTQEIDGFGSGEPFSFRVWDASTAEELSAAPGQYIMGNGRYSAGSTHVLTLISAVHGNQSPVLSEIGDRSVNEGEELVIALEASDPDGDELVFWNSLGGEMGSNVFTWTPSFDEAGEYQFTFRVSDGELTDEETIAVTVTGVNRPPVLSEIGNRSIAEGEELVITLEASDPDGDELAFWNSLGGDMGGNVFTWTPSFDEAGEYQFTFRVTDGELSDEETITVTVTDVNRRPELVGIGNRSIAEGEELVITLEASDPDGDELTFWNSLGGEMGSNVFIWTPSFDEAGEHPVTFRVSDGELSDEETISVNVIDMNRPPELAEIGNRSVNEGEELVIALEASDPDGDELAFWNSLQGDMGGNVFTWTPSFDDAGEHQFTFRVTDGELSDEETIIVTVTDVNRPPELVGIGNRSIAEGEELVITLEASDPDGDELAFWNSLQGEMGSNVFTWTPNFDEAGEYQFTFRVSDGELSDEETITVTVTGVNRPPVLSEIGNRSISEGEELVIALEASDPDGDELAFWNSLEGDMGGNVFTWTPSFDEAGEYQFTFRVTDGELSDEETITVTVTDVNRPPELAGIGNRSVNEGEELVIAFEASDPDGDELAFWNSLYGDMGGNIFTWTPSFDDAGEYQFTFRVTDGELTDEETITITVTGVNRPPELAGIGNRSVSEGEELVIALEASDPDGDELAFWNSLEGDMGGNVFTWTPNFDEAGEYQFTFRVTDGELTDEETITVTVTGVNRPPELAGIGNRSVSEGEELVIALEANDPDGDELAFWNSLGGEMGSNVFTWTPSFDDAGEYQFTFRVTDGELSDEETITVTVTDVNRPPELVGIGNRSVSEGEELVIALEAIDPDGDELAFWNSLDGNMGGNIFTWTPSFDDAGEYQFTFRVSDGELTDEETITVTVTGVNRLPELAGIGNRSVSEGEELVIALEASDPDGDELAFWNSFDGDMGGNIFTWTPSFDEAGEYQFTFRVTDGELCDEETITVTVTGVNRPPELAGIGNPSVSEGEELVIALEAIDPDGDELAFWNSLDGDMGGNIFTWTPTFDDAGEYHFTFRVTDGALSDEETTTVTVTGVNRPPELAGIGNRSIAEGEELVIALEAIDPDGDELAFWNSLDGDMGGNIFTWTPSFDDAGEYQITFRVTDGELTDEETITVEVLNVNRPPEIAMEIEDIEFAEDCGEQRLVDLDQVFFDPDGDELTYTFDGPAELNLALNQNNELMINPESNFNGSFEIVVTATDEANRFVGIGIRHYDSPDRDGDRGSRNLRLVSPKSLTPQRDDAISDRFQLTLVPQNDRPTWIACEDQIAETGVEFSLELSAIDIDGDALTLECDLGEFPDEATFTDNGDGTGCFAWLPGLVDVGDYQLVVVVSDGFLTSEINVAIEVVARPQHFTNFDQTGDNHLFLVTEFTLDGEPVDDFWEVGVFAPGDVLCGAGIWLGEDLGFPAWGADDDHQNYFQAGDQMLLKVWDPVTGTELPGHAVVEEGVMIWMVNGFTVLSIEAIRTKTLRIDFTQSWNLISINITPGEEFWVREEGPDVVRMMAQLDRGPQERHHIILMKNEAGDFYSPDIPAPNGFNNIRFWDLTQGYQVRMDQAISSEWTGQPIDPQTDIPIARGWNIIAYYPDYRLNARPPQFEVLSPIIENVVIAKDVDGSFMVPPRNFSNMPPWRETQGYQINVNQDVVLNYPMEEEQRAAVAVDPEIDERGHWAAVPSTGSNMSVLITSFAGIKPFDGDQVAAFDADDNIVGLGTVQDGGLCGLAVWGDDPSTDQVDGLRRGEGFTLHLWSRENDAEHYLEANMQQGKLFYETDGFVMLTASVAVSLPAEFYLSSCYPNPFNSSTKITFGLPEASRVSIKVFDTFGREVASLVDQELEAGHHFTTWEKPAVGSGVYLIRMQSSGFEGVRKVMVLE